MEDSYTVEFANIGNMVSLTIVGDFQIAVPRPAYWGGGFKQTVKSIVVVNPRMMYRRKDGGVTFRCADSRDSVTVHNAVGATIVGVSKTGVVASDIVA